MDILKQVKANAHIPRGSGDAEYHIVAKTGETLAIIDPNMALDDPALVATNIARAINVSSKELDPRDALIAELAYALGETLSRYAPRASTFSQKQLALIERAKEGLAYDTGSGVAIIVEGGLVESIFSRNPLLVGMPVSVIDMDIEGADEDRLTTIKDLDGRSKRAYVQTDTVVQPEIDLADLDAQLAAEG